VVFVEQALLDIIHQCQLIRRQSLFIAPACLDLLIQVASPLNVVLEDGNALKHQAEPLRKKLLDATDITLKVILCINVRRRCHLRKVYHSNLLALVYHEVEFVEVTVDEAMLSELHD